MIESYHFGRMAIDGRTFTADLIILPDRILTNWWRKEGHLLCLDDLNEALKEGPDALVLGTGALGMLKIEEEVQRYLRERKIEFLPGKTKKAIDLFNEWAPRKRTVGAFHLTC
jgi:hypothetical protein